MQSNIYSAPLRTEPDPGQAETTSSHRLPDSGIDLRIDSFVSIKWIRARPSDGLSAPQRPPDPH